MVMNELEKELQAARQVYLEAIDNNDEQTENEYTDIISAIARILNSKNPNLTSYQQWYSGNEHPIENLKCPKEILDEVKEFAKYPNGFNKEVVDKWNQYLDFNLHTKLKTYGMVGAARLNKIFNLK